VYNDSCCVGILYANQVTTFASLPLSHSQAAPAARLLFLLGVQHITNQALPQYPPLSQAAPAARARACVRRASSSLTCPAASSASARIRSRSVYSCVADWVMRKLPGLG
jgi:hypothetical protein